MTILVYPNLAAMWVGDIPSSALSEYDWYFPYHFIRHSVTSFSRSDPFWILPTRSIHILPSSLGWLFKLSFLIQKNGWSTCSFQDWHTCLNVIWDWWSKQDNMIWLISENPGFPIRAFSIWISSNWAILFPSLWIWSDDAGLFPDILSGKFKCFVNMVDQSFDLLRNINLLYKIESSRIFMDKKDPKMDIWEGLKLH